AMGCSSTMTCSVRLLSDAADQRNEMFSDDLTSPGWLSQYNENIGAELGLGRGDDNDLLVGLPSLAHYTGILFGTKSSRSGTAACRRWPSVPLWPEASRQRMSQPLRIHSRSRTLDFSGRGFMGLSPPVPPSPPGSRRYHGK
ncbi:hypothetical protein U1Q18_027682, partial [Sarracenia purpurea var. burkii]